MDQNLVQCKKSTSIREAMQLIEKNTIGTAFIVDDDNKLCGVVTDGDIRRALLDGIGLSDRVSSIIKNDFVYAKTDENSDSIASKFTHAIRILPIVDENMHLVDYSEYHENSHLSLATPLLNGNEYSYLMDAFLSTWISSSGKYVESFEKNFAQYCGVRFGVATSNGTTALHLALTALGIGPGDEVIVPNLTFAATINAVMYTGATPVIVDIDEDSWCIDPEKFLEAITERTKAVIPVHIYGQPCDMGKICSIAKDKNIFIIEDCAEAHGAEWDGKKIGGFGIISCFSFYGNKVITTGEGGMCLTNDLVLNEKMRLYRDHGMRKDKRYYHEVIGFNYRMTNLQAAIGTAQVEHINEILLWRSKLEEVYREVFSSNKRIVLQNSKLPKRDKITWLVSVLVPSKDRDDVIYALKNEGIDVRPFFVPLSEMEIYKGFVDRKCHVSEDISHMGINLPTTYDMNRDKVYKVFKTINQCL